ncbi:MAG: class I SAM-dependent methyltransferase [Candidatus Taylorbacteria bacterium]|nr:class I SAM-dependent methyltransferase [Candidatus Taylorbacteria bacterium]
MFSDPQKNIEQLRLLPDAHVADFGSGAGHYTLAAAKAVGNMGRVYAIDVLKEMLQKLKNQAERAGFINVESVWGNIEKLGGTRLADASVDAVLVCNTLFQVEDKKDLPVEAKRILKPHGKILVVDWKESFGGMGPQSGHVVDSATARSLFEKVGFTFEREISAGAHHYGMILRRA